MNGYKQYYLVAKHPDIDEVTIAKVPGVGSDTNLETIVTRIVEEIRLIEEQVIKNRDKASDSYDLASAALDVALQAKSTADAAMEAVGSGGTGGEGSTNHCCVHKVIDSRFRDPSKPSYGFDVGGDPENPVVPVQIDIAPYTGTKEVSVVASGTIYDTDQLGINRNIEDIPDGMIILGKMEE